MTRRSRAEFTTLTNAVARERMTPKETPPLPARRRPRRLSGFICGITPKDARDARLSDVGTDCPNAAHHAPMPADYGPFDEIATKRTNAKQRNLRCDACGLWCIWTGGRDVPGWPRMAVHHV